MQIICKNMHCPMFKYMQQVENSVISKYMKKLYDHMHQYALYIKICRYMQKNYAEICRDMQFKICKNIPEI